MSGQNLHGSLNVTLLAGSDRALRSLVLDQLIAQTRLQRTTVLTFDSQRLSTEANRPAPLRRVEPKPIKISQPGLVVPFRADFFWN
jgi:hypothetical protein